VGLWLCLSCGWVACSDDSPNQHAKSHYQDRPSRRRLAGAWPSPALVLYPSAHRL